MTDINGILINFLATIPVWVILTFFLLRLIRENDQFKKDTINNFDSIKSTLSNLDKNLALVQKDIDYASNLSKVVSGLTESLASIKKDLDHYYNRLRTLEGTTNES